VRTPAADAPIPPKRRELGFDVDELAPSELAGLHHLAQAFAHASAA
jgi:hypothetical protein